MSAPPPDAGDFAPAAEASRPPRRRWLEHPLFHLFLFLLTLGTTTLAGNAFVAPQGGIFGGGSYWDGLAFSLPALTILGLHEMGHYIACRRYGIAATLPYFLPLPVNLFGLFGTMGAVIRIKEPIRDKRVLLDVGAAGPLAGFAASLPFLVYGVMHPRPAAAASGGGSVLFDYPLAVRFLQDWTGVGRYDSSGIQEHPAFMAGWLGLLVTALNLLPIGQLDGGHVLRAAAGRRQPLVSAIVVGLCIVSLVRSPAWAIFAMIATLLVGIAHPPVENDDEPLGTGRLTVALICACVFLLCFTLTPIRFVPPAEAPAQPGTSTTKVAGPLLTRSTSMKAPNSPVSTVMPAPRRASTNAS
jgi:membrane-associated protease RseP (regulator of RpoE activity)